MLVMRRRAGESFLIGDDIEIQILDVGQNRVRIGVRAPSSVAIVRKEVVLTRDENRTAAGRVSSEGIAWISEQLRSAAILAGRRAESEKKGRNESRSPDM